MKNKIKLISTVTANGTTNETVELAKGNVENHEIVFYSQVGDDSLLNKITIDSDKVSIQRGTNTMFLEMNKLTKNDYVAHFGTFELNTILTGISKETFAWEIEYNMHALDVKQYFKIRIEWGEIND